MIIESSTLTLQNQHEEQQSSALYRRATDTELQTMTRTHESETLALSAVGEVTTNEGDVLDITLQSLLSRYTSYQSYSSVTLASLIDPLVINLDGGLAQVDKSETFAFDLNSDGTEDEISLLGKNNGFLAFDKNENGIIDDGSELFGTQSGDGFADLSAYDEDGNGWIDENDSIFSKLKIWQKNATQNSLISLSQAQVGALLLESTDTSFSYKNGADTNAQLKESSVVLFENGKAGWMSHVDFAVHSPSVPSETSTNQTTTVTTHAVLSSALAKIKSSSSDVNESMLSALKSRLRALQHRLGKTHDSSERSALVVQILKISMQIAMLGG
jgi:hypothetical protein